MLDSIYHMTLKFWCENIKILLSFWFVTEATKGGVPDLPTHEFR